MGWDSCSDWTTIVKARTAMLSEIGSVVEHVVTSNGRTCWMVIEDRPGDRTLLVAIFTSFKETRNDGTKFTTWGFKVMSESEGPFNYDCPLKYLDITREKNPEWRDDVRKYHANLSKTYSAGDRVKVYGRDYVVVAKSSKKGCYDVRMVVEGVTIPKVYRASTKIIEPA